MRGQAGTDPTVRDGGHAHVVAFAGRRIDAPGAPVRFPPASEPAVERRLRDLLRDIAPSAIVSSAACGADLLALEAAASLGIRLRIILPFDHARFRATSVTDRPGDWGVRYDAILDAALPADRIVLGLEGTDDAYAATNREILDQADLLAGAAGRVLAVIAWDGRPRGQTDLTAAFRDEAVRQGLAVHEIDTRAVHAD